VRLCCFFWEREDFGGRDFLVWRKILRWRKKFDSMKNSEVAKKI
jgi:hypothetical protein